MAEPKCPQKGPYVVNEEPGTYAWCACGLSEDQPYCDGSHVVTEFEPMVVEIEEARRVSWCGCKRSGNKPFCDGAHRDLD